MAQLRGITEAEHAALLQRGCSIESPENVWVSSDFSVVQLWNARLLGRVEIASGARIFNSTVSNYSLGESALIETVARLESAPGATMGNGVGVASLNENGGRTIQITDQLTAQVAHIWVMWRHRAATIEHLSAIAEEYAASKRSNMGSVGAHSSIIGSGIVRSLHIADNVTIEGASRLENGTLLSGVYVGANVTARDFLAVENSRIDTGANLERAVVGEGVIVAGGFTLIDSLLFAGSHCEAGEAVSIFGGPYTVSHHKATLLIAGFFSFFNAGSGTNQSNHLFKSGAVHQAQHLRGVKFASDSYVMAPAAEGVFTTVLGRNTKHHDTRDLPFSILIGEADGRSTLIPAMNITAYGTVRDIEKWGARDKRSVKRDVVDYQQYNPMVTGAMLRGLNTLHALHEAKPEAASYTHNRVNISAAMLNRGVKLYNKAIAASLGSMLAASSQGAAVQGGDLQSVGAHSYGEWLDIAGQYISRNAVEAILSAVERGEFTSFEAIALRFKEFNVSYAQHAAAWALSLLEQLHGKKPTPEMITEAIEAGARAAEELTTQAMRDRARDWSTDMMVGYGVDTQSEEELKADFVAVRGEATV